MKINKRKTTKVIDKPTKNTTVIQIMNENKNILLLDIERLHTGGIKIYIKSEYGFETLRSPSEIRPTISLGGQKVYRCVKDTELVSIFNIGDDKPEALLFNPDDKMVNMSYLLHPNIKDGVVFNFPNLLVDTKSIQSFAIAMKEQVIKIYHSFVKPVKIGIKIEEIRSGF